MVKKINRKKFFLSIASFFLALGLIFSAVQDSKRMDDGNKNIVSISEEGEVKGGEIMANCSYYPLCDFPAGPGGCYQAGGPCGSGEFSCPTHQNVCCDRGSCDSCNPCTGVYQGSNNGCPSTSKSCTRYDCRGSCGTTTLTCYLIQYSISYSAGNGGSISGATNQSVCYNQRGSQVTAVANSGYTFSQWSDGNTSPSRSDVATGNKSFTASFTQSPNNPPTAPTSPLTNGQTNPTGVTTPTPYFSAIFNDPDSGDTGVHYQIQVNTNSSFTGTTMWDSGKTAMTSTTNGSRSPNITYAGTNLPLDGTMYYWRIKFWDNNGADSPWSATAQFTMRYTIPAPSGLLTNGQTNPTGVTTPYPYFSAIYNNYSGRGNATHAHLQVYLGSVLPENQVWNFNDAIPNVAPGNRSSNITYGGDPLPQNGATYIWRIRFWDGVAYYSEWQHGQFTMNSGSSPTAPTGLLTNGQTNPVGVTTPQPYFSAIFNDPNGGDTAVYYQIFVVYYDGFTYQTQWDSGKTAMTPTPVGSRSPNITYNGPTLQAGREYNWQIKFWDNSGLEGVFSNISSNRFTMNTPPTAPTAPLTNGMTNPTDVASTPYFSAIFNDADSTDTGVYYQIQVNTNSSFSGTTMWDSGKTAMTATNPSSRSPNINYAGNTLSYNGTTYYWRIRFWDNHGVVSPYSSTAQFTTVISGAAPTSLLTNGQTNPTNVVPSPAPYFSAIFNHSNPSRRAVHYQIIMTVSGIQVWNSGKTSMTSTAPGSRCPNITYNGSHTLDHNGNVYKWTIVFWDDLGVQTATSAEAQFTMNRRPTPPTGLLTEGQTNPSGVTDTTPEFSAIYNNPTGKPAVHYQIQVNTRADFNGTMMWNSGQVSMSSLSNGSRSPDISYAGNTLTQNGQTYYWKIRFWDNIGGDGEWSDVNHFTMYSATYTYTISPAGTQVTPLQIDQIDPDIDTYMGGVYYFNEYNPNPGMGLPPRVTNITLQRTWVSGGGDITHATLRYVFPSSGESCPTTLPTSTSLFGEATDPYGSSSSVTINGSMYLDAGACLYVLYAFDPRGIEGSVLDFQITNFTTSISGTKVGLPSNIQGTTTFIPPPQPPTFTNIANNGPKDPGGTITFSTTSSDPDGDNVKLVVCKTQGVTGTACDGGDDDTYCTSSFVGSNPSCSWDIPSVYPDGSYYAYPYIFDSTNLPADSIRQGAAHAFTVNNVAPLPTSISINGGDDITLVTGTTKSVTLNVSVRDNNGCGNDEIDTVKAYMYRSGITGGYSSCDTLDESNANNCYPEIPCTFVSCTGTQSDLPNVANYTCTTSLQYYADPTDTYAPFAEESWVATAKATDNGFGTGGTNPLTGTWGITQGVDVNSLLAFNVTQELNYGTRLAGELMSPLPKTITISSAGNIALNHTVSGDDMCEDYPTCEGSKILVDQQRYGLSASTSWQDGTKLSATPTNVFTNLPKQTTSTPTSVNIWWGILAPTGTAPKQYTGKNTITSSVAY